MPCTKKTSKRAKGRAQSENAVKISVGIQDDVLTSINALSLANQTAFILAVTTAFIDSDNANPLYVASVPMRGKIVPKTIWINPKIQRLWQKVADKIADGSLSKLFQAAMHQHFPLQEKKVA